MTTYRVTVTVETIGGPETTPLTATWSHTRRSGDSPRYYGSEVRKAITAAADLAASAQVPVDLVDFKP